jgi:hypothetical protein
MEQLRIIVGGMIGQFPLGGVAWDYGHYVMALHELGHDVYYHEDTNTWPYNPLIREPSNDAVYSANFIRTFFQQHAPALVNRWHYRFMQHKCFGLTREAFDDVAKTCDIYLNISGVCILPSNLSGHCRKVFVDTDPGYNQFRLQDMLDTEGPKAERYVEVAKQHHVHLTYAQNIHKKDCILPLAGLNWITTRPTVTLPHWRFAINTPLPLDAAYTTVMTLDLSKKSKPLQYRGVDYGDKRAEFERFVALPRRVPDSTLLLAIDSPEGLKPILENGWKVMDACHAALTSGAYRDFIASSAGEWSIAKNIYVASKSGWFSCRTCCYLAAGRPAVVQDTTWSRYIPSGDGLIAFDTLEQAAAGLESLRRDPYRHRVAAYDLAREYLAPDRVVAPMLEHISAVPGESVKNSVDNYGCGSK